MRWLLRAPIALLAMLALGVATSGCGKSTADGEADPVSVVPAAALLYVEAVVQPEGDQAAAARQVLGRFGVDNPGEQVARLFNHRHPGSRQIDYAEDVEPWLGRRIGLFAAPVTGGRGKGLAAVVAVEDTELAIRKLRELGPRTERRERSYRDVSYDVSDRGDAIGAVDGFVVGGDEAAFRAVVDASRGDSLAETDRFRRATAGALTDRLGLLYFDHARLPDFIGAAGGGIGPGILLRSMLSRVRAQPVAATLSARPDALVVDSSTAVTGPGAEGAGRSTPLLAALPGDSWLAFGAPGAGRSLSRTVGLLSGGPLLGGNLLRRLFRGRTGLELERDVLSAVGDVAVYARGTRRRRVSGGAVIETPSPERATELVADLRRAFVRMSRRQAARRGAGLPFGPGDHDGRFRPRRAHGPFAPGAGRGPLGLLFGRHGRRAGDHRARRGGGFAVGPAPRGERGFSIRKRRRGHRPVTVVARGDRVAITFGGAPPRQVLEPRTRLGDAAGYREAVGRLGEGLQPGGFVDFASILALAQSMGAGEDEDFRRARRHLEVISHLVVGDRRDGDRLRGRAVLGLK